jgi:hypothetical protein
MHLESFEIRNSHIDAIVIPTAAVSMKAFDNSFVALDKMNFSFSPPKHLSGHTFKSLKYDVAPGESVYSAIELAY